MQTNIFDIEQAANAAKQAAPVLATLSAAKKQALLQAIAAQLREQQPHIVQANQQDLHNAKQNGLSQAMLDRLVLDASAIQALACAVEQIAAQPDPVGSVASLTPMPSGIQVGKMRIPLGVVAMIYESRPNVTIDAAALCLKAGNAVILRGGKEAQQSNLALAACIQQALAGQELPGALVTLIPDPDRAIMQRMLTLSDQLDLIIPRGGEGLIRYVSQHSQVPVIQHYKGVCHLYVAASADHQQALALLENGKTQRTGVCNALETLLVDQHIAESWLPKAAALLAKHQVTVHACPQSIGYFEQALAATEDDWHAEYLAAEIAIKVVADDAAAKAHIQQYGSGHTEVIVTQQHQQAQCFLREVDAAVVMVNASSRFSDGGELGLGAEIGISTSKLHAYGPMGVSALTTEKFVVLGEGQVRT